MLFIGTWRTQLYMSKMVSGRGTCTIRFTDKSEKDRAFYELIHSKKQFSGIDKNTLVIQEKDCVYLESKNIKYEKIQ